MKSISFHDSLNNTAAARAFRSQGEGVPTRVDLETFAKSLVEAVRPLASVAHADPHGTESPDAEIVRRASELMSKTAGAHFPHAVGFLFRENPGLYEKWRADYA